MSILSNRRDPGPCPVCGEAHSCCTSGDKNAAIVVQQLPARDRVQGSPAVVVESARRIGPGPTEFSTKTYRRSEHGPKKVARRR